MRATPEPVLVLNVLGLPRRWHERYGAVLVAATLDVMEFEVARPPRDRGVAKALAWEQFVYCNDIVHQGVETLNNLAAALLNARFWYFWWD